MLSTDGRASFAAFTYSDPGAVVSIQGNRQIGFDAGDELRGTAILGLAETENNLEEVNIFRIDGKILRFN